jgi:hypothetical protein
MIMVIEEKENQSYRAGGCDIGVHPCSSKNKTHSFSYTDKK